MKKKLLYLGVLCLVFSSKTLLAQVTSIPDINFEQALINDGYDDAPANGSVPTANIVGIINLDVSGESITSLEGIADFTALQTLNVSNNSLTILDVSSNTELTTLNCSTNQIVILNLSQNASLTNLNVNGNALTTLDLRNGSNTELTTMDASSNPTLTCMEVDNAADASVGIAPYNSWTLDPATGYCSLTTWTSTGSSDWNTPSNWSDGVPDATTSAVIANTGTTARIAASVNVLNITVVNNATLDVNRLGQLTIHGNLNVQSLGTFSALSTPISGSASIIVNGSSTGNLTYDIEVTDDWHTISPPIAGEIINSDWITNNSLAEGGSHSAGGNNFGLGQYDPTNPLNSTTGGWDYVFSSISAPFEDARGYIVNRDPAGFVNFTGTIRTNNVSRDIISGTFSNWNLIGNPFTSSIKANVPADAVNSFLAVNGNRLAATHVGLYVWDNSSGSYTIINNISAATHIAPGQGFFVLNDGSMSTSIDFNTNMQSHQSGDLFYRNGQTIPTIELVVSDEHTIRTTTIKYVAGTSVGLDPGFDAGVFSGQSSDLSIYTKLVDHSHATNFTLQALPNSNYENMIIPVGLNALSDRVITFHVNTQNLPAGTHVFLEDKATGKITQLDIANSTYKVKLTDSVSDIGRFYLHTNKSEAHLTTNTIEQVQLYTIDPKTIRIHGLGLGKTQVSVFNLLGQSMLGTSYDIDGVRDLPLSSNIKSGIYIVKLSSSLGEVSKKIIIK